MGCQNYKGSADPGNISRSYLYAFFSRVAEAQNKIWSMRDALMTATKQSSVGYEYIEFNGFGDFPLTFNVGAGAATIGVFKAWVVAHAPEWIPYL
jgi:hypothetical protein